MMSTRMNLSHWLKSLIVLTNLDLTKEDISCYNPFNNIIQIINR
jgi:hypothetical protein